MRLMTSLEENGKNSMRWKTALRMGCWEGCSHLGGADIEGVVEGVSLLSHAIAAQGIVHIPWPMRHHHKPLVHHLHLKNSEPRTVSRRRYFARSDGYLLVAERCMAGVAS